MKRGEEQIRRLIAPENGYRHGYVERDGVLVLSEYRREGWEPGGLHGAECHGGPLKGIVVLVEEREDRAGTHLVVEGDCSGSYEWGYSDEREGAVIGRYRIGGLYWRTHPSEGGAR